MASFARTFKLAFEVPRPTPLRRLEAKKRHRNEQRQQRIALEARLSAALRLVAGESTAA